MENWGTGSGDSGFGLKKQQEKQMDFVVENKPFQRMEKRLSTCTGFEEADWQKALLQKKSQSNCYYKGKQVETPVSLPFFKTYGSGVYLFFSFAWQISILFLFFTILSIVPITINYLKGSAFTNNEQSLQFYVTKASIGNYQYSDQNLTYQQSINYKIANVVMDILMTFAFMVFCLYWQHKSKKIVQQINLTIKLLSANTLQVIKFPEGVKQNDIQSFMSKFGEVVEVAPVKNYSSQIQLSKQIYEKRLEIRQLEIVKAQGKQACAQQKIQALKKLSQELEKKLQSSQKTKQQYLKFYVQFQKSETRDSILQQFAPYQRTFTCCMQPPAPEMLLKNQIIHVVPCQSQPTGIIWENVHVTWATRWLRLLVQGIIVLAVIAGGFLFISFLNVLLPPSQKNIDTSSYTWKTIQEQQDTAIVQSWCNKNIQFSTTSQYYTFCFSYWKKYILSTLIIIGISIMIVILKAIIKIIMVLIAKFQRYTSHTEQSVTIMTNLLITYLSTTVLITFLIQANFFSISFKSIIKNFISDPNLLDNLSKISEYRDLSSRWYLDIGYQIWFNVFTLSFIPHLFMPIVYHILQCISHCRGRSQKLYYKMYEHIQPAQFQIQDNYANLLMIILIGFVFGGGSPCMLVVSFVGLITRYVYYKYIFVRFCRIPKTYNESLNNRAITILKIILLIRCLISLYMYGADDIFAMEKSAFMKWSQSLQFPLFSSIFVVISRIFLTWYYSMFVILFILIIIFNQLIVNNILKLCNKQQINKLQQTNTQLKADNFEIISQRALTKSYKLQNNPDYKQILAIMKMKNRNKISQRQEIIPVPIIGSIQPMK